MAHIYSERGTCSGENQNVNILKIAANKYKVVVLSSKAGAQKQ